MKHIKNTQGYYITEDGKVFSKRYYYSYKGKTKTFREISQAKDKKGYHYVGVMFKDGKRRSIKVHRLIAEAFLWNPRRLPQVNHIDSNKSNNNVLNLEWVTNKKNMAHAVKADAFKNRKTSRDKKTVIDGVEYKTRTEAAKKLGLPISTVSKMANYGDKWREVERKRLKKYHTKEYRERSKNCITDLSL